MKICVIGAFGFDDPEKYYGGQPAKTRELFKLLQELYGQTNVIYCETYGWKKRPFSFLNLVIKSVCKSEITIMLPANNGIKLFAPLLAFYKKRGKRVYYDVIGGWLPEMVKNSRLLKKSLLLFDGIWVETKYMMKKLSEEGLDNVRVVPNFKSKEPINEDCLVYGIGEPYKLCTFSRVMKEKGIEDAVNAVKIANERLGKPEFCLDIYGQVDEKQIEWFESLQKTFPDYIDYGGLVPSDKSIMVLRSYYALLFPTYYEGEGFAGTLLDAMAAGVPVIASDWKYNNEIIKERETGLLHNAKDTADLADKLIYCREHIDLWNSMKKKCIAEAEKYSKATVSKIIFDELS